MKRSKKLPIDRKGSPFTDKTPPESPSIRRTRELRAANEQVDRTRRGLAKIFGTKKKNNG